MFPCFQFFVLANLTVSRPLFCIRSQRAVALSWVTKGRLELCPLCTVFAINCTGEGDRYHKGLLCYDVRHCRFCYQPEQGIWPVHYLERDSVRPGRDSSRVRCYQFDIWPGDFASSSVIGVTLKRGLAIWQHGNHPVA
jgi:hypothetical protein